MFTEIALTPHVFEEESNPDNELWLESLRELGREISPRNAAEPIIIADLYKGSCLHEALRAIGNISDHRVKDHAQRICAQMKKYAAPRPDELEWPVYEEDWTKEASQSHAKEPLGRILLSDNYFQSYAANSEPCYSIYHTIDEQSGFWNGIRSHGDVEMNISTQVDTLRPICIHADYIAIRLPYVNGGDDDETIFAGKVIKSAINRPSGYPELKFVEMHLDGGRISRFDNVVSNITSKVKEIVSSDGVLKMYFYFWPHFTDRELIAGFCQNEIKYPRWGISMNHIAKPNETQSMTHWSIIAQKDIGDIQTDTDNVEIVYKTEAII